MMKYILLIGGGVLLVLALAIIFMVGVLLQQPVSLNGTLVEPAEPVEPFTLASGGGLVSTEDYRGKFIVLVFGYTYCPDACPTTLSRVSRALQLLDKKANAVSVMMVSVDPERDSPDRVSEYTEPFGPRFTGLTGSPDEIADVASRFGIYYEKASTDSTENYVVDHTTTTIVLDRRGNIVMLWSFDLTAEELAADLEFLIDHR